MRVHRSNRTELLADALADLLRHGPADPMVPEIVAVQGRGMERWLTMHLAERLGVAANLRFVFPRTVVEEALTGLLGEEAGTERYRPERLVFDLLEILPSLLPDERFAQLSRYLEESPLRPGEPIDARALGLVTRIASAFDRYFTYRPDLVLRWLQGKETPDEAGYQPVLLRALREKTGKKTLPELLEAARPRLASGTFTPPWPRLSLFGISTLPPCYLELLEAFGESVPVHLFWLAPSAHYIGDQLSRRQEARERLQHGEGEALYLGAHPLLASFGKVARDFQTVLASTVADDGNALGLEREEPASLLHVLQDDLWELREPHEREAISLGAIDFRELPEPFASDRSIEIHACHGMTRQIEVLRDVLVRLFDEIPDLEPRDVVVMAPNIDELAPTIDAVFSFGDDDRVAHAGFPRLPYRIADRRGSHDNPVADATLALLELARGRLRAPEVLAFLGREPVGRRFGFDTADLGILRRWLDETGIRLGEDGDHRASFGLPAEDDQTFREGLSRMLLGHLMRGEGTRLYEGQLAYDDASDPRLLGAFVAAIDGLFSILRELRRPQTLEGFGQVLQRALDELFQVPSDEHRQLQAVRDALAELGEPSGLDDEPVFTLDAFARLLTLPLTAPRSDSFVSGAITFCAMVPMRAVPFRVVCLLGIDDGVFPRRSMPDGFDLAPDHRPGDRKLEDDDRCLFLEALLSARDRFLVFHSGRSPADNKRLPRAVPVEELLDAMAETMPIDADRRVIRDRVVERYVVEHPLTAYSPASFTRREHPIDARSYDRQRLATARSLLGSSEPSPRFLSQRLPLRAEKASLTPQELGRFLANPALGFLESRLGIRPHAEEALLDDRERLELDALESYGVHDAAIELLRADVSEDRIAPLLRARSLLPLGIAGKVSSREAISAAARFRESFASLESAKKPPLPVDLEIGGVRIVGRLHGMGEKGRLVVTWARAKARRRIEQWVQHLIHCALAPDDEPRTFLVERDGDDEARITAFAPVRDAEAKLEELVELWREGQAAPLLFFAEPAKVYADKLASKRGSDEERRQQALAAAFKQLQDESDHPHLLRLFEGRGPELFTRELDWPYSDYRFPDLFEAIWKAADEGIER